MGKHIVLPQIMTINNLRVVQDLAICWAKQILAMPSINSSFTQPTTRTFFGDNAPFIKFFRGFLRSCSHLHCHTRWYEPNREAAVSFPTGNPSNPIQVITILMYWGIVLSGIVFHKLKRANSQTFCENLFARQYSKLCTTPPLVFFQFSTQNLGATWPGPARVSLPRGTSVRGESLGTRLCCC